MRPLWGRAASTVVHGTQFLPPGNIVELRCLPPLRGSLEQLVRPSPAGVPFQDTELAGELMLYGGSECYSIASSPLLSPLLGIKTHFSKVDLVCRAHLATWPLFSP